MLLIFLLVNTSLNNKNFFVLDVSLKKELSFLSDVIWIRRSKCVVDLFFLSILYFFRFIFFKFKFKLNQKCVVYGADHLSGAKFFLRKYPFFLIEDGTANYDPKTYKRSWKNKLFSIPTFGVYKNVKKIYLTQKENIPEIIKHKVEIIDIKALWESKSSQEKEYILSFFNMDSTNLEKLKQRKVILFTQPLSEDGILTESEKVELYSKVINNYSFEELVIKPHPREKTDYAKHFSDICLFKENCPSELLELLGIDFERVVTLFSTAALQYPESKVDFYGASCHPKLKEKFGNIDFYMVNSFIK